jgi:hypothetical protein
MKKTIYNVLATCGGLLVCTLVATNYGTVSSAFGLLGSVTKGLGNITLVVLGQSDRINRNTSYAPNIGDDGSAGSGRVPMKPYQD